MCEASCMFGLRRDRATKIASRSMRQISRSLRGREHDGVVVKSTFHYGAVDIDPKHLVVWIMLTGRPDEELPAWLKISDSLLPGLRPTGVDYDWLLGLKNEIVETFSRNGWSRDDVDVLVDSDHRVETNGGWLYFK